MMNQEEDNKVYRSVNRYTNYTTGEDYLEYGRNYNNIGPARSYATQIRRNTKQFRSNHTGKFEYFEFLDTWCEVATEWERV